jgi:hypothetical protein
MELLEFGFVVEKINVGGRAVLEQVDDSFCFRRDLRASGQSASGGWGRQSASAEQTGESG